VTRAVIYLVLFGIESVAKLSVSIVHGERDAGIADGAVQENSSERSDLRRATNKNTYPFPQVSNPLHVLLSPKRARSCALSDEV